jgi:hypothetical protein
VALHEMDPPRFLTPADQEQRHGRILRNGNENSEVQIFQYGMERTADAGIYHRIETKARFIKQVLCGVGDLDQFEDPASQVTQSLAELKALLTGDARVLEHVTLKEEVRQLKLQREGFFRQLGNKRALLRQNEEAIRSLKAHELPRAERLRQVAQGPLEAFLAKRQQTRSSFLVTHAGRAATVDGERFTGILETLFSKASNAGMAEGGEVVFQVDGLNFALRRHFFDANTFCYELRDDVATKRPLHSANVQGPAGFLRSLATLQGRSAMAVGELTQEWQQREQNCVALRAELSNAAWPGEGQYHDKSQQLLRLEAELLRDAGQSAEPQENAKGHTEDTQCDHKKEEALNETQIVVDAHSSKRVTTVPVIKQRSCS